MPPGTFKFADDFLALWDRAGELFAHEMGNVHGQTSLSCVAKVSPATYLELEKQLSQKASYRSDMSRFRAMASHVNIAYALGLIEVVPDAGIFLPDNVAIPDIAFPYTGPVLFDFGFCHADVKVLFDQDEIARTLERQRCRASGLDAQSIRKNKLLNAKFKDRASKADWNF